MGEDLTRIRLDQLTKEDLIQLCVAWANHAQELQKIVESPMITVLRKAQMQESAQLIRDELVCPCESFQKMEAIPFVDGKPDRAARSKRHASIDHHDICFFGEWAAVIVERGPRDGQVRKKRVGQGDPPG
jgi:hypothetical protein